VQLKLKITRGDEVKWAGGASRNDPIYYGGPPPETGVWKLSTEKIEDYFEAALQDLHFGDSIDIFVLGFEIADLEGWGDIFTSMSQYTSYRPKTKLVISVGQLNWPDVKDLSATEQFQRFSVILLEAIARVGTMKRKPKSFDTSAFLAEVTRLLALCPAAEMEESEYT